MLHHGLSRPHAHFGDLDCAPASLGKAYQNAPADRSFQGSLGRIPDPMLDTASGRHKDEPRFREAVKTLKKKYER